MLKRKTLFSIVAVALMLFGIIGAASAATLTAQEGQARLIFSNRSYANMPTTLTIRGSYSPEMEHQPGRDFEGGQEFIVNAGDELVLDVSPGYYTTEWTAWTHEDVNGFGPDLFVSAGDVIVVWSRPESQQAFIEFNGSPAIQVK